MGNEKVAFAESNATSIFERLVCWDCTKKKKNIQIVYLGRALALRTVKKWCLADFEIVISTWRINLTLDGPSGIDDDIAYTFSGKKLKDYN